MTATAGEEIVGKIVSEIFATIKKKGEGEEATTQTETPTKAVMVEEKVPTSQRIELMKKNLKRVCKPQIQYYHVDEVLNEAISTVVRIRGIEDIFDIEAETITAVTINKKLYFVFKGDLGEFSLPLGDVCDVLGRIYKIISKYDLESGLPRTEEPEFWRFILSLNIPARALPPEWYELPQNLPPCPERIIILDAIDGIAVILKKGKDVVALLDSDIEQVVNSIRMAERGKLGGEPVNLPCAL